MTVQWTLITSNHRGKPAAQPIIDGLDYFRQVIQFHGQRHLIGSLPGLLQDRSTKLGAQGTYIRRTNFGLRFCQ